MSCYIRDDIRVSLGDQELQDVFVLMGWFLVELGKTVRFNQVEELGCRGVMQVIKMQVKVSYYQ